jgi:hypothetical protein
VHIANPGADLDVHQGGQILIAQERWNDLENKHLHLSQVRKQAETLQKA